MIQFSPYAYAFHEDPYPTYARLRREAPVYRNDEIGFWAFSRHADVLWGFKDCETFTNRAGVAMEQAGFGDPQQTSFILAMDPPRHDHLRALVAKAFTGRRVVELEPRIREIARQHAQRAAAGGSCDYVQDFAGRLPMDVISELLGVPEADRESLRRWADLVVERRDGEVSVPPAAMEASAKLIHYFMEFVGDKKRSNADGLIEALLRAEVDGERLTDNDVTSFLFLMIIAGNETTTKMLANAVYWISKNPPQRKLVDENSALIPNWVEETLRYDNSSQILARKAARDFELRGQKIREGEWVLLLVGSANRDEDVFPDADRFDLFRDCSESLSFGKGVHFCLGAQLARLEGRIGLETTQEFFPNFEVDFENLARVHSSNVRGFARMPIRFDSRP